MPIVIREANSTEDLEKVYKFRYSVYVNELGRKEYFADHERETICEPHDSSARIIAAYDNDRIVGTLRNNFAGNKCYASGSEMNADAKLFGMQSCGRWFPNHVSVSAKFMVEKSSRSGVAAMRLIRDNYLYLGSIGSHFDFIECQPGLISFYEKVGYRIYREDIIHPYYGRATAMVAAITDLNHFQLVASPLTGICQKFNLPAVRLSDWPSSKVCNESFGVGANLPISMEFA